MTGNAAEKLQPWEIKKKIEITKAMQSFANLSLNNDPGIMMKDTKCAESDTNR